MVALSETEALYRALSYPLGLVLTVSDFQRAQSRLYAARAKAGDPALAVLQLRRDPYGLNSNQLWIVKAGQHQLQRPDDEAHLKEPPID